MKNWTFGPMDRSIICIFKGPLFSKKLRNTRDYEIFQDIFKINTLSQLS